MGKFSRDKGNRNERKIVNILKDAGIPARRVPLSGATEYAKGDIEIHPYFRDYVGSVEESEVNWAVDGEHLRRAEVKSGKSLPTKRIRDWLEGNDVLILDEDHKDILVVMSLKTMIELL